VTVAEVPESIDDCDFTIRTYNCLKREDIHTVGAMALTEDQLLDIRNFGQRSVDECVAKLAEYGMHLRANPSRDWDGYNWLGSPPVVGELASTSTPQAAVSGIRLPRRSASWPDGRATAPPKAGDDPPPF
jgi:DNA-directed RNA polymerase subunit alpha